LLNLRNLARREQRNVERNGRRLGHLAENGGPGIADFDHVDSTTEVAAGPSIDVSHI
jgi:hypothetical protein